MKKIIVLLICLCMLLACSFTTVFGTAEGADNIFPMAENYINASASISRTGSNIRATGTINGKIGKTTKTEIHLYLQKYLRGKWLNVSEWSSSSATETSALSKTVSVKKGYRYRTKAVCSAYAGNNKETVIRYSQTLDY